MTASVKPNVRYTTQEATVDLHVPDPWHALFRFAKTITTPPDPEKEQRWNEMQARLAAEKQKKPEKRGNRRG